MSRSGRAMFIRRRRRKEEEEKEEELKEEKKEILDVSVCIVRCACVPAEGL